MRITLVLPNHTMATIGRSWVRRRRRMPYAPTTLTALAGLVPADLDARVELIDEGVEPVDLSSVEADLVGISVMTPNAPRAYAMSRQLRARGIKVVLGGVHPTLNPGDAQPHADAVVVGYADETWPQLLRDLRAGRLASCYEGRPVGRFQGPGQTPAYDLVRKERYWFPVTLESTRGCRNSCRFCVVPRVADGVYGKRSIEDVIAEIRLRKAKRVAFLDQSPAEDAEHWTALYEALVPLGVRWYGSVSLKQASRRDWVKLAAMSGCRGVLIGFESLNDQALRGEAKGFNRVEQYGETIRNLHDHGILVFGSFMFGFDGDGPEIFGRTARFVDEHAIDLVNPGIFTPFPGTPDFARMEAEGRILTRDWSKYDCTRVVFEPRGMTTAELQEGYYEFYRRVHGLRSIVRRVARSRCSVPLTLGTNLALRFYGRSAYRHVPAYSG